MDLRQTYYHGRHEDGINSQSPDMTMPVKILSTIPMDKKHPLQCTL